jgi:putative ABC transport system permease protein
LGADRGRIAGLLLSESVLLAVLGGIGGVILARAVLQPFVSAFPMALPRTMDIQMDPRVVLVSFVATVATGLLLGLLPVLRSSRMDLNSVLRDGGHGSAGGRRSARTQGLLVVSEVALSVLLLGTSGIFVESYLNSARQDRGFVSEDVLIFRMNLPEGRAESPADVRLFYTQLEERLATIPGVLSVGMAQQMPYGGCCSSPPASVETTEGVLEVTIHNPAVTPGYFETMGIPIVRGRSLLGDDRSDGAPVVVVSEAMAARYWPGEDPIGKRVRHESGEDARWADVVGVSANVRYQFGGSEFVEYYRAFEQSSYASQSITLKVASGATGVADAASRAVHALDPTIPVNVRSLTELSRRDSQYRSARLGSLILVVLAAVATGLAILGVYSVLAYSVMQRTREIGIRVSLGGTRLQVLRTVLGRGLVMSGVGVVVGLGLSIAAAALLRAGLVDVGAVNPRVLVAVTAMMIGTSVVASLLPALRAVRVDPLVAFRED